MRHTTFSKILAKERYPTDLGDGDEKYPLVGVRWWGKGVFIREEKKGHNIKRKRHYRLKKNQVIYNKLFAWRGAFTVVDSIANGCFVSDKFPTYTLIDGSVSLDFLRLIFTSRRLAKEAEARSVGSVAISKFTLNPPKFLDLPIRILTYEQQNKIVEAAQRMDEKISYASSTLETLELDLGQGEGLLFERFTESTPRKRMGELGKLVRQSTKIQDEVRYTQITIGMNNKGIRFRGEKYGRDIGVKNQAITRAGDVVFSRIDIRNGAIGFVPVELDGATVANDFPAYVLNDTLLPDFADAAFRSPEFRRQCIDKSAGSTNRKKMRRDRFLELSVPAPTIARQREILEELGAYRRWMEPMRTRMRSLVEDVTSLREQLVNQILE